MKADFLNNETYKFLFSSMKYENALIMRTCLETGLRVGDVCSLPASALQGNTIRYTAQKTGKRGSAQISSDLASRLYKPGAVWLFPSPHNLSKHRTRQAVWRDVKLACARLGISEHVSPHSARKTFAVDLYRKKGLTAVQNALQHDRIDTTMIYAFSDVLGKKSTKNVENFVENINIEQFAELIAQKVYEKIQGIA
jgi:integrase